MTTPLTGINVCYLSDTPYRTKRVTLMVSADAFNSAIIEAMKGISVWKGADKRRQTPDFREVGKHIYPEVQEISWEINPEDATQVFEVMDDLQQAIITNTRGYLKLVKDDASLQDADCRMQ